MIVKCYVVRRHPHDPFGQAIELQRPVRISLKYQNLSMRLRMKTSADWKAASASMFAGIEPVSIRPRPAAAPRRARHPSRRAAACPPRPSRCRRLLPLARSSSQRRRARSVRLAVTKSFACASGKITVPMSRPSSTAPSRAAKSRWKASNAARTPGMDATDAAAASA